MGVLITVLALLSVGALGHGLEPAYRARVTVLTVEPSTGRLAKAIEGGLAGRVTRTAVESELRQSRPDGLVVLLDGGMARPEKAAEILAGSIEAMLVGRPEPIPFGVLVVQQSGPGAQLIPAAGSLGDRLARRLPAQAVMLCVVRCRPGRAERV